MRTVMIRSAVFQCFSISATSQAATSSPPHVREGWFLSLDWVSCMALIHLMLVLVVWWTNLPELRLRSRCFGRQATWRASSARAFGRPLRCCHRDPLEKRGFLCHRILSAPSQARLRAADPRAQARG